MTAAPIALGFVPKLSTKARLRWDRHAGAHMIVYPERGITLNDSAAAIVKRCDGTRTVGQIIEELAAEVEGAERSRIEVDVVDLVASLARKGLLEP